VHGSIIDIGADTVADCVAIARSLGRLTKVLLFVGNVMFGAGYDTSALDALNGLGKLYARQDRIGTVSVC